MIFGIAYQTIPATLKACEDTIGRTRVQLLSNDDQPSHRRAFVVVGVSCLQRLAPALRRCRATVVVVDALPELRRVEDIKLLDATADGGWAPMNPRWRELIRDLKKASCDVPNVRIGADEEIANLISEVGSRGVLQAVLTFAQRADATSRAAIHDSVSRFLHGTLSLATVARRTRPVPPRGPRVKIHAAMIEALGSERATLLSKAIKRAEAGEDPAALADELDVDAFEVRYVIELRKRHAAKV